MYTYSVKTLRSEATYLWGSPNIRLLINSPLCLTIKVLEMGEEVTIFQDLGNDKIIEVGKLKESQIFIVPLNRLIGIFVTCDFDAIIECTVMNGQGSSFIPYLSTPDQ